MAKMNAVKMNAVLKIALAALCINLPLMDGEDILLAEIDRSQIVRGKFDLDVVGHYARPDIFQLHVDEHAKLPVIQNSGSNADEHSVQESGKIVQHAADRER